MDRYIATGLLGGAVIGAPLAFGYAFLLSWAGVDVSGFPSYVLGAGGAWIGCEIGARLWGGE